MKMKDLTPAQIEETFRESHTYNDMAERIYKKYKIDTTPNTCGRYCRKLGITRKGAPKYIEPPMQDGHVQAPDALRQKFTAKRIVFTCAQNNTKVHKPFMDSLMNFCEDREAELIVGKITYNKSGFQNGWKGNDALSWAKELEPYFCDKSMVVSEGTTSSMSDDLIWCGEMNILPTEVNPLSGLENYTRAASGIVPHTKVRMRSIANGKFLPTKHMYTTGAITRRNYIEKKTGQKAAFHHVFGALYVEIDDDGTWFARQLVADNAGCFYDLTDYYHPNGVSRGHSVEAINWGDIHAEEIDCDVAKGAMGIDMLGRRKWKFHKASMMSVLRPKYQFVHDVSDFRARNHHNIKDPHIRMWQHHGGYNDNVKAGFLEIAEVLDLMEKDFCETVVVQSNHDLALDKWLREADYRTDPENADFFLWCQLEYYRKLKAGKAPGSFNMMEWVLRAYKDLNRTKFLLIDESFVICAGDDDNGIECSMHGHIGPNGSWGSPAKFTKIGTKCNTGHTHSAGIVDGVYTAGVSCKLDMGYNKGPSSWSHSHIVTYPNGKRCIITMRGVRWQAGMEV